MWDQREWTDRALCVGRDPRLYELDDFKGDKEVYARGACVGCEVIAECADDALEPLAVGTVRGGVWVAPEWIKRRRVLRQLEEAAGIDRHA